MTGLIQKNLLAGHVNRFMIIFVMALAVVGGVIVRVPGAHTVASFSIGGAFTTSFLFHFHRKDDAVWQKLETVMPIRPAFVELSRYLSFLVIFALICAGGFIYTFVNYASGVFCCRHAAVSELVNSLQAIVSLYFLLGAILFPALRFFDAKRSVTVTYVSFLLAFAVFFAGIYVLFQWFEMPREIGNWKFAGVSVLLYVLSYFLSLRLYRRRIVWYENRTN